MFKEVFRMVPTPTILVVDDEEKMISVIQNYLEQEGFKVLTALNGQEALNKVRTFSDIDLILLDWMMPGLSGIDVCKQVRQTSEIPIIFLTAKSEEFDKLKGLEIGADDYITKPFSMRELVARIRVILRRIQKNQSTQPEESNKDLFVRGNITIDYAKRYVEVRGKAVSLTKTEFKLLTILIQRPGQVFSRLQLLEMVFGEEYAGYERSIDTHISNLRKKIDEDPSNPDYIQTVFGVGYKFGELV